MTNHLRATMRELSAVDDAILRLVCPECGNVGVRFQYATANHGASVSHCRLFVQGADDFTALAEWAIESALLAAKPKRRKS